MGKDKTDHGRVIDAAFREESVRIWRQAVERSGKLPAISGSVFYCLASGNAYLIVLR